jgi:3D (Asp-Asp-Asp) domain-containing protein/peptidoglycan hydrolase CwlO-like protein
VWVTIGTFLLTILPQLTSANESSNLGQQENQLHVAQSQLQSLQDQQQATLQQARDLQQQVSNLMFQSIAVEKNIEDTQGKINKRNELLKQRMKVMYINGDSTYLDVLFGATDFRDFVDRLDTLSLIVHQDNDLITEMNQAYKQLKSDQSQLHAEQVELQTKQTQLFALGKQLQDQVKAKQSQIADKQEEINQTKAVQAAELAAQAVDRQASTLPTRGEVTPISSSTPYLMVVATAYTAPPGSITKSGAPVGPHTIAVDPKVIPLGTKLYIEGYGYGVATDTGGDIKGNRIDLFYDNVDQCILFGRQVVKVYRLS